MILAFALWLIFLSAPFSRSDSDLNSKLWFGTEDGAGITEIVSPNGLVKFSFSLTSSGEPSYSVTRAGEPVVQLSKLGLAGRSARDAQGHNFSGNFTLISSSKVYANAVWAPVWGEREQIPDHYYELTVNLQHETGFPMLQIRIRAYDEGVAFQYSFPGESETQTVQKDLTEYNMPAGSMAYYTPGAQRFYERKPIAPEEFKGPFEWDTDCELPLTVELASGLWISVAEAGQTNFTRKRLRATGQDRLATALFEEVTLEGAFSTPWHVVLVGTAPGQLLEHNYIILNLNPPNEILDTSWIHPGRAMMEVTMVTSKFKASVDFAVKRNIDYLLLDAGWYGNEYDPSSDATRANSTTGDLNIQEAINYAKANGRRIMLYVNHIALEQQLEQLFPLYQSWGVDGVKFGFVTVGSRRWTVWLHKAIKLAAFYHLVVDVHDDYRPTGFSRTYPNLLNVEGIAGDEAFPTATQSTIYPFTRFIAGHADHTYCFLYPKLKKTKAHQLALTVVNFGPLQLLSWYDSLYDYLPNPNGTSEAPNIDFWKDLPTVWDDTRVVAGTPGEFVIVARRKREDWWIGAITNETSRTLDIPLDFLPPQKAFTAHIYEDAGHSDISVRVDEVDRRTVLACPVLASGGAAVRVQAMRK